MRKHIIILMLSTLLLAACSSSPNRIESDEKLPVSPCACGPQVKPLMWDTV